MIDFSNCEIELIEEVPCLNEKELLKFEDFYIQKFREEGKEVRNVKINIKQDKQKTYK